MKTLQPFAIACLLTPALFALPARVDLDAILKQRILQPRQSFEEVQRFLLSRVKKVPRFGSAEKWIAYAADLRRKILQTVVFRGEARAWRDMKSAVEWLDTIPGGPGYHIRKLRYEAVPGLWIPALLYEPSSLDAAAKVPVILNVNGHDGKGKVAPYKQIRCINQAKRGMLALNVDWLGMGQLRSDGFLHYRMNQLDLCGTSGLSVFYLAMSRALDILVAHEHAEVDRVAVTGLSGGGWQTIIISALDTRVTFACPVAGYSSFASRLVHNESLGDSEQAPTDLGAVADYTHLTALLAPRYALLTYNATDDCCFRANNALQPLLDAADPVYALLGCAAHLRDHVNYEPGNHNYRLDNREALYDSLGYFFFFADRDYKTTEIPSEDEVKTAAELHVELPPGNANFHSLALKLAAGLPRRGDARGEAVTRRRGKLRQIVGVRTFQVDALRVGDGPESPSGTDVSTTAWKLEFDGTWTVPAVEIAPREPKTTVVVLADDGRAAMTDRVRALLREGARVVAVDPFYLGESRIEGRDFLFALQLNSHGERLLGLQASQLAAIAGWLSAVRDLGPVSIATRGPRSGLAALVAAALDETRTIGTLRPEASLRSLHQIIEQDMTVKEAPELFCFGLLESFDIDDLTALAARQ